MIEKKLVTVILKYDSGSPVFEFPTDAKIFVNVYDGDNDEMKEILIEGNRAGLHSLAKALLAVSETKAYHAHFDNEMNVFYKSYQGFTLTLSNNEKIKYPEKRTTNAPPPDW